MAIPTDTAMIKCELSGMETLECPTDALQLLNHLISQKFDFVLLRSNRNGCVIPYVPGTAAEDRDLAGLGPARASTARPVRTSPRRPRGAQVHPRSRGEQYERALVSVGRRARGGLLPARAGRTARSSTPSPATSAPSRPCSPSAGGECLPDWLDAVRQDGLPSLHALAAGIDRDRDAVTAGLTLPWSSGVVEGNVNRIKMLKRQMFGRAGFALLRKRVLMSWSPTRGGTPWQPRRRMCKPSPSRY